MERLRIIIPLKGRARIKHIKKEAAGAAPFVFDFSRFRAFRYCSMNSPRFSRLSAAKPSFVMSSARMRSSALMTARM